MIIEGQSFVQCADIRHQTQLCPLYEQCNTSISKISASFLKEKLDGKIANEQIRYQVLATSDKAKMTTVEVVEPVKVQMWLDFDL